MGRAVAHGRSMFKALYIAPGLLHQRLELLGWVKLGEESILEGPSPRLASLYSLTLL